MNRSRLAIAASKRLYSAITAENTITPARNDDPSRDSAAVYEVVDGLPPRKADDGAPGTQRSMFRFPKRFVVQST